jgi:hypothetical protein
VVVATVVAVILSEYALDPADVAYWKRWLGRTAYWARRIGLTVVPAALGALAGLTMASGESIVLDVLRGAASGVAASAMLRAGPTRRLPRRGPGVADDRYVTSALAWLYGRACHRLDAAAEASIILFFSGLKVPCPGFPRGLLDCGEEVATVLNVERGSGPPSARLAAGESVERIREHMDVLADPLTASARRQTAAFALAELLSSEFVRRRWHRRPAR